MTFKHPRMKTVGVWYHIYLDIAVSKLERGWSHGKAHKAYPLSILVYRRLEDTEM